ncbi:MAG: HTH domain-containing protein, partial [Eubacterium sp.]|nr:HTH domain-containing protein [Eubacterium sp.]
MNASERREKLLKYIRKQTEPVSASVLAGEFNVSRQIIVGDIAILRAAGNQIDATPRGYLLQTQEAEGIRRQIVSLHTPEQMEEELNICVDYGC